MVFLRVNLSLLINGDTKSQPKIPIYENIGLEHGRVHECYGPAKLFFPFILAQRCKSPILWIRPSYSKHMVNPDGVSKWVNPHRFIFVNSPSFKNALWCIEESLRVGTPPLIIAELEQIPTLTQIRRMHLAAKSCKSSNIAPLPLILTPKDGSALCVETRWDIRPNHANKPYQWRLDLTRARLLPEKKFFLTEIKNRLEISLPT